MLKNYFKLILRNLKRQKGYSFINITGLVIGLSCCLLIMLYIRYEFSYDAYHADAENIYRAVREQQGKAVWLNSSEHPLAASLKADFPEVVKATRVKKNDEVGVVEYKSKRFNESGIYFVDQDMLEIFTFPLVSGDQHTALKEPFSLVITEEMAKKYLGSENPVGKTLMINDWYAEKKQNYTITGVLKNIPKNSHFTFDFLVSYNTMYSLKKSGKEGVETWNYFEPKTYIKLVSKTNPKDLESKFPAFLKKYKGEDSASEKLRLQPLKEIHLGGNLSYELEPNNDKRMIYMFSAVAFFILLIACLNYINLSVARSAKRAVEVGVRKVVGANKSQLVMQFLFESMVFSLLALVIAFLLADCLLPVFSSLMDRNFTLNFFQNLEMLWVFLGTAVFIGFFSGSYPAFFLSSFLPIRVIKGTLRISSKGSAVFRGSLVVTQFVVSIILIICTFVIHDQLNYIKNRDLGFEKEQIITLYTMDENLKRNPDYLKTELLKNPNILGISASLDLPSTIRRTNTLGWDNKGEKRNSNLNFTFVDQDYFDVYNIEIIKGRNFSKEFSTDKTNAMIINETAARDLGWKDPIGKRLYSSRNEWTVIGVIKDIHFKSLHSKIDPVVFLYNGQWGIDYFSIKIAPTNISSSIEFIEKKWKTLSPEYPFQYAFLDERIDRIYKAEQNLGQTFNIFTLVALSIAGLGLIGLMSFVSEQKKKEISIRKILGADSRKIIVLLSKEYIRCIAVAVGIAWPVGYFVMDRWLQNFAYKTNLQIDIFIFSGLMAFVFALITVSYQTIKSAIANPIDSLRCE